MIEIWQPRWHDRKVLIAKRKVRQGLNEIVFTKTKSLQEHYFILGTEIARYPIETNGVIDCYAVPLSLFKTEKSINSSIGLTSAKPSTTINQGECHVHTPERSLEVGNVGRVNIDYKQDLFL